MFREMRRKKQLLSQEESLMVLKAGTHGVLAVSGDGDYPYAVPLSYVYDQGKIYFHCARTGHKLDALARSAKVSFCVVAQDKIVPEEYTTYFKSVIIFGTARRLDAPEEKRAALLTLAAKYSPQDEAGCQAEVDKQLPYVCLVEITIDHLSGKESIELTRARNSSASAPKEAEHGLD